MKKALISLLTACASFAMLQGCGAPGKAIDRDAQTELARVAMQKPSDSEFPDVASAKWVQGSFPNLENLQKMAPGVGKDQARELLGWPHFSEGLWGVTQWDYIFHFRTSADKADDIICQYMVRFSSEGLVTGGWWKPSTCARLAWSPRG